MRAFEGKRENEYTGAGLHISRAVSTEIRANVSRIEAQFPDISIRELELLFFQSVREVFAGRALDVRFAAADAADAAADAAYDAARGLD